jgi:PilZ domain
MEHRCGNRRIVDARITIRTRSGLVARGILRNVSASGALVNSPLPLPLHTSVFVQIEATDGHQPFCRVALAGEISRVTDDGFAIEWAEFAPQTLRAILRTTEHGQLPGVRNADVG